MSLTGGRCEQNRACEAEGGSRVSLHEALPNYVGIIFQVRRACPDRIRAAAFLPPLDAWHSCRCLTISFFPCGAQVVDRQQRATRSSKVLKRLIDSSKSPLRRSQRSREVSCARSLLPFGSMPCVPATVCACRGPCGPPQRRSLPGMCPVWTCRAGLCSG